MLFLLKTPKQSISFLNPHSLTAEWFTSYGPTYLLPPLSHHILITVQPPAFEAYLCLCTRASSLEERVDGTLYHPAITPNTLQAFSVWFIWSTMFLYWCICLISASPRKIQTLQKQRPHLFNSSLCLRILALSLAHKTCPICSVNMVEQRYAERNWLGRSCVLDSGGLYLEFLHVYRDSFADLYSSMTEKWTMTNIWCCELYTNTRVFMKRELKWHKLNALGCLFHIVRWERLLVCLFCVCQRRFLEKDTYP